MKSFYIFAKNINVMAQTAMTIRMDSDLKIKFNNLCEELGMSANTAFNIFARQAVRKRSIPFTIEASSKEDIRTQALEAIERIRQSAIESGVADMSLEEINEEISLARKAR